MGAAMSRDIDTEIQRDTQTYRDTWTHIYRNTHTDIHTKIYTDTHKVTHTQTHTKRPETRIPRTTETHPQVCVHVIHTLFAEKKKSFVALLRPKGHSYPHTLALPTPSLGSERRGDPSFRRLAGMSYTSRPLLCGGLFSGSCSTGKQAPHSLFSS